MRTSTTAPALPRVLSIASPRSGHSVVSLPQLLAALLMGLRTPADGDGRTSAAPSPCLLPTYISVLVCCGITDAAVAREGNDADVEDGGSSSLIRFAAYPHHPADVLGAIAVVGGMGRLGRAVTRRSYASHGCNCFGCHPDIGVCA